MYKKIFFSLLVIFINIFYAEHHTNYTYYNPLEININHKNLNHFSYVNVDAPKGGKIIYGKEGTFANFNPMLPQGVAGCASMWTFDRLMFRSFEELIGYYPLVAESFEIDQNSITFFLHANAKWSNGEKITAYDVKNAFECLQTKSFDYLKFDYYDVKNVEIIDDEIIKFIFFDNYKSDLITKLMNIPLITPEAFENPLYMGKTSGAYTVVYYMPDEFIHYKRNINYWAQNLPVNMGRFNFNDVICKYYNNYQIAIEAFKVGEYDVHNEKKMKNWQLNYQNFENNELQKIILHSKAATANKVRTLAFNTQKYPFNKLNVRKALNFLFDFDEMNRMNFLNGYNRAENLIAGLDFVSLNKKFDENELEILEQYDIDIKYLTNNDEPIKCSQNRAQCINNAIFLFKKEGFVIENGMMKDANGQQLVLEIDLAKQHLSGLMQNFIDTLTSLGIKVEINILDNITYSRTLREKNFSILSYDYYFGRIPNSELYTYFHSNFSDKGYMNIQKINNTDLDKLIELINKKNPNLNELKVYLNILNRIFIANYYVIFLWHNPYYRLITWDKFGIPENFANAEYYDEKNLFGADSWWQKI